MTDRFISPEQPPEGLDRELLVILMEECAEITQRASKALRFGLHEVQPGQPLSNIERLDDEVGDLMAVVGRLSDRRILNMASVELAADRKDKKLHRFLQSEPTDAPE